MSTTKETAVQAFRSLHNAAVSSSCISMSAVSSSISASSSGSTGTASASSSASNAATEKNLNGNKRQIRFVRNQDELEKLNLDQIHILNEEAVSGNPEAQIELGICYLNGFGVAKNKKLAFVNYKLAADQGYARAQNDLAYCYKFGIGVAENEELAFANYKLAADQGLVVAQFNLGICYRNGFGVKKDEKRALESYKSAADQGFFPAQVKFQELRAKIDEMEKKKGQEIEKRGNLACSATATNGNIASSSSATATMPMVQAATASSEPVTTSSVSGGQARPLMFAKPSRRFTCIATLSSVQQEKNSGNGLKKPRGEKVKTSATNSVP